MSKEDPKKSGGAEKELSPDTQQHFLHPEEGEEGMGSIIEYFDSGVLGMVESTFPNEIGVTSQPGRLTTSFDDVLSLLGDDDPEINRQPSGGDVGGGFPPTQQPAQHRPATRDLAFEKVKLESQKAQFQSRLNELLIVGMDEGGARLILQEDGLVEEEIDKQLAELEKIAPQVPQVPQEQLQGPPSIHPERDLSFAENLPVTHYYTTIPGFRNFTRKELEKIDRNMGGGEEITINVPITCELTGDQMKELSEMGVVIEKATVPVQTLTREGAARYQEQAKLDLERAIAESMRHVPNEGGGAPSPERASAPARPKLIPEPPEKKQDRLEANEGVTPAKQDDCDIDYSYCSDGESSGEDVDYSSSDEDDEKDIPPRSTSPTSADPAQVPQEISRD